MPPNKKKRGPINPNATFGIKRSHLKEHFSQLPADSDELLNGHVHHVFFSSGDTIRAKTVRLLCSHYPLASSSGSLGQSNIRERRVQAGLKKIIERYDKFHKCSDPRRFENFRVHCRENFSLLPVPVPVMPPHEIDISEPEETVVRIPPKSPVTQTRQVSKCVSCKRLRLDIKALQARQLQMRANHVRKVKDIYATQKKTASVKKLTQKLKRKDIQLKNAKIGMDSSLLFERLTKAEKTITLLEKKHKRLMYYHKDKRKSTSSSTIDDADRIVALEANLAKKNDEIVDLQNIKLLIEERMAELEANVKLTKSDGKSYTSLIRMVVFDGIVNQVPTNIIPIMIVQFARRFEITLNDVPNRTTVESMARELGAISELQSAEMIIKNNNLTLGFDATTQEGTHVNSIHVTTTTGCIACAVDELPGGTSQDYHQHIVDTVDNLAYVYSYFNDTDYSEAKATIISNISNTMTDRCAANHAAIQLLNSTWNKTLNELNCHLHPLDSIATKASTALKKCEKIDEKKLFGTECFGKNIVVQMNKIRYKDGKGDPQGFIIFLEQSKLPRGLIPRYRGNRLHILFHICGIYYQYHELFHKFLEQGTKVGGLRAGIMKDFTSTTGIVELQILGLLGKLLSGPWMKLFYTSALTQMDHVEGIKWVKQVVNEMKLLMEDPMALLTRTSDFFGKEITPDATLDRLREKPRDKKLFETMTKACLETTIDVLERQYKRYFKTEITAKFIDETKSARSHNIDAEEVMGRFSAAKKKAPNATLDYLSCKMRAQKNRTVQYLDTLDKHRRDDVIKKAVKLGTTQRRKRREKQADLRLELYTRQEVKQQVRVTTEKTKLETRLKKTKITELEINFPHLNQETLKKVTEILTGKAVGNYICHIWYVEGQLIMYNGKIEEVLSKTKYEVAYWTSDESYDEAVDYEMTKWALAADLISSDLTM